ncbi:hypothetical protein LZ32DRAFT_7059 [Colletotrichum eremochloae]|nr:hypothetical protein LZ32DRAFT_7059 [Colletotrichum eremochloae]
MGVLVWKHVACSHPLTRRGDTLYNHSPGERDSSRSAEKQGKSQTHRCNSERVQPEQTEKSIAEENQPSPDPHAPPSFPSIAVSSTHGVAIGSSKPLSVHFCAYEGRCDEEKLKKTRGPRKTKRGIVEMTRLRRAGMLLTSLPPFPLFARSNPPPSETSAWHSNHWRLRVLPR